MPKALPSPVPLAQFKFAFAQSINLTHFICQFHGMGNYHQGYMFLMVKF